MGQSIIDQNPDVCWHISRLGSLTSLFYFFKSIASASVPHIHQYLMSMRFEKQNCKSEELKGIFIFPITNIRSTLINNMWVPVYLQNIMFLCLKVSTSLSALAKVENDILKQKGETVNSFLLPYLHGLSNFVVWKLAVGLVFFSIIRHLIIF